MASSNPNQLLDTTGVTAATVHLTEDMWPDVPAIVRDTDPIPSREKEACEIALRLLLASSVEYEPPKYD